MALGTSELSWGGIERLAHGADRAVVLATGAGGADDRGEYSTNGTWVIQTTRGDIVAVSSTVGDTTRRSVVDGPADERWPAMSPNGQWLVEGEVEMTERPCTLASPASVR